MGKITLKQISDLIKSIPELELLYFLDPLVSMRYSGTIIHFDTEEKTVDISIGGKIDKVIDNLEKLKQFLTKLKNILER